MAGNYMDAPSDRIAWDRDGSIGTRISGTGQVTALTPVERRLLNGEDAVGVNVSTTNPRMFAVVFPTPMDLSAAFFATLRGKAETPAAPLWTVETSKDTSNGLDGTWSSQFLTGLDLGQPVKPNYRQASRLLMLQTNSSSSDLRGIRFVATSTSSTQWSDGAGSIRALHLYGVPASTATQERLAIWRPDADGKTPPTWFDWGDVPRSSSADRQFRIKNMSPVSTATDIDLYVEALTPGIPSVAAMHTFSDNGGATFLTGLNIASLAPGEVSDVITVRRTVPADAAVSVWSARIAADVNQWIGA